MEKEGQESQRKAVVDLIKTISGIFLDKRHFSRHLLTFKQTQEVKKKSRGVGAHKGPSQQKIY